MTTSCCTRLSFCLLLLSLPSIGFGGQAEDRAAIEKAVESYTAAYNASDAKALAAHWSEHAVYQNPLSGAEVTGRAAIEKEFTAVLEATKGAQLEVDVQSIEFVSPSVAVEHGVARVIRDDEEPEISEYSAVHVKQGDRWLMDRVTEKEPIEIPSHYNQLRPLEWMLGVWVDEDETARVESSCQWAKNQNFLTRTFTVELPNEPSLSGVQIIGWDASQGRIRSWAFDSDGGFAEGTWISKGDRWIVETAASSINVIRMLDENTATWQITGRDVDGEILPNLPEVKITRNPSADQEAASFPPATVR